MNGSWWSCPSCRTPVPFEYQLEEAFGNGGEATFDPGGSLSPSPDDESLSACWLRVLRCPNPDCDSAWALMLYPTSKALFEDEIATNPA